MTKDKDYSKECLVCQGGTISMNPFAYQDLLKWHNAGHPKTTSAISQIREGNGSIALPSNVSIKPVKSAQSTPKEKSISEILDTAFNSDHTNGSHADDPSDKRPCYCHNRQYAEQALTTLILKARLNEWEQMKKNYPTAPYIPDFISEARITELNREIKALNTKIGTDDEKTS